MKSSHSHREEHFNVSIRMQPSKQEAIPLTSLLIENRLAACSRDPHEYIGRSKQPNRRHRDDWGGSLRNIFSLSVLICTRLAHRKSWQCVIKAPSMRLEQDGKKQETAPQPLQIPVGHMTFLDCEL